MINIFWKVVVEKKGSDFEPTRVGRFFILGSCLVCPCVRSWYLVLERTVKFPGTKGALAKVVLDQGLFAPAFLSVFVTAASTLQGLSLQVIAKGNIENYNNAFHLPGY